MDPSSSMHTNGVLSVADDYHRFDVTSSVAKSLLQTALPHEPPPVLPAPICLLPPPPALPLRYIFRANVWGAIYPVPRVALATLIKVLIILVGLEEMVKVSRGEAIDHAFRRVYVGRVPPVPLSSVKKESVKKGAGCRGGSRSSC